MVINYIDHCASHEWLARYRAHGHVIECNVHNHGDEYTAFIHVDGVEIGFAEWMQCEHVRSVYSTSISKRWSWLTSVIKDEFGIIVPMKA